MNMRKEIILVLCATILTGLGVLCWNKWLAPTKIAFMNYQVIELGEISSANENKFVKISVVGPEQADDLDDYDMLFVNGMGLKITEEQRADIQQAAAKGLSVMTTAATNPANVVVSVDSLQSVALAAYLSGGGRKNFRNMLEYVRSEIDGKVLWVSVPGKPSARKIWQFSHPDPEDSSREYVGFDSVREYNKFLRANSLLSDGAPVIVITGQMGEPSELIGKLEQTGNVVFRVADINRFIAEGQSDSVAVSAVINMAHGRLGDNVTDYLAERNIPLFAPLNVNRPVQDWEADKMGMNGGFMSQSIVTPEIDGAIRPFALFGHYRDDDGMLRVRAIPSRLSEFVESVNRHLALKSIPNSKKRVAIVYYKGPGQNALTAAGMEVVNSLYNLLVCMKNEGYKVELPASADHLGTLLQSRGTFFETYAAGSFSDFIKSGDPELVTSERFRDWTSKSLGHSACDELAEVNGPFPGSFMTCGEAVALPRVELGNVVLMPQLPAADGDDSFRIVHGADVAPTYNYVASYLWLRYGFKADVLVHFGTHGSLEFTPGKQVALSSDDWSDRLVGTLPHLYVYSIGDVGEGMIAKRRSYATLVSHLTPPFMESEIRGIYKELTDALEVYDRTHSESAARNVSALTVKLGIHRELGLDSLSVFGEDDILRVENFAEELVREKVTGELYTMGKSYSQERIKTSVYAMCVEPIAYSLLALDKLRGNADSSFEKRKSLFGRRYIEPSRRLVAKLYSSNSDVSDETVCQVAGISGQELSRARDVIKSLEAPGNIMAKMHSMASGGFSQHNLTTDTKVAKALAMAKKLGADDEALKKMKAAMERKISSSRGAGHSGMKTSTGHSGMKSSTESSGMQDMSAMMKIMTGGTEYSKEDINKARAILEIERTVKNVVRYRKALSESPRQELATLMNAMDGGYVLPSAGGDPIANPNTIPTGRNLYSINAEATPSEAAWEKGKQLSAETIRMYRSRHNDSIPRKVSYTLWSGEFIESEGATVAQVLYMLGVEPVRDVFGRVSDIRLIPSEELGRPRIDVVVQTSGQLRDIAASRLFLISRAVEMAASSKDDKFVNYVASNTLAAEQSLIDKGLSPKEAREISSYRVFGGVNGNYGTGITGMVQNGGAWESESEIASVYINNMGAFYGSEKNWEQMSRYAFEAALANTDAVVQPRQSNTWGALSLDHVYEFMGGINLAVRNVTGKEPDAYLSDYRNRNNARMQEVKEAIGIESRTTILNPSYIKEKMKGGAGSAAEFSEIVRNTYGWDVMKPEAIDGQLWDEIYNVYIEDSFNLGVRDFLEAKSPSSLETITTTMLETARKGMWKASESQIATLSGLHSQLIANYNLSSSSVLSNDKLKDFISRNLDSESAAKYNDNLSSVTEAADAADGIVMKKETLHKETASGRTVVSNIVVVLIVLGISGLLLWMVYKRRRQMGE